MSSRTQGRRKAPVEPVLDDWDASEPEDGPASLAAPESSSSSSSSSTGTRLPFNGQPPRVLSRPEAGRGTGKEDIWGSDRNGIGGRAPAQGKKLWEEANQSRPAVQPVFSSTRVLPQSVLAPSLASSSSPFSSSSSPGAASGAALPSVAGAPPPRILRRERLSEAEEAARRAALSQGQAERKTLQQREEEYRRARERIFGTSGSSDKEQRANKSGSSTPSERAPPSR
ncbi:hypothetical protein FA10DRAFT_301481 [Acaromyces ingoldii]|uniref:SUZ domain-containing protein n=1 Tax=Acaromyces ingoldii TaxID=215250 RepID=A0A316YLE9_9BASI|nr:hypothetical protein FA10DRAFT_301481 [Acaromyces ingoldii]PWN90207.1 hypothetical protein FA10DRAFT_301481 [Acaromyces ingoldii]